MFGDLEERDRVGRIGRQRLVDIPMLDDTASIESEKVHQRQWGLAIHLKVYRADIAIVSLVQDRPVLAWDQEGQELDGGCTTLWCIGTVIDVVGRDVGQVRVRGVLLHVELVDEVEEDRVLLGWRDRPRRAVGASRNVARLRITVATTPRRWDGHEGGDKPEHSSDLKTHYDCE